MFSFIFHNKIFHFYFAIFLKQKINFWLVFVAKKGIGIKETISHDEFVL